MLRAAGYLLHRLMRRDHLTAKARYFDLSLTAGVEDVIGRHLYKYGAHEAAVTEFLIDTLSFTDGDVVFDIGANVGWYSLILDRLCGVRSVDIFAFEPDPTNHSLLRKNLQDNAATRVQPYQLAVADEAATRSLHLYKKSNRGRHSLLAIHEGETVDVETVVLDQFWQTRGLGTRTPRFLKLDIEGFELMALRGAPDILSRCPMVMLEYSPRYMKQTSLVPGDLIDLMLGHGFSAHSLHEGHLVPLDAGALRQSDEQVDLFWLK